MPSPLHRLERSLRTRLAETLPGVQAQLKFAPTPARPGWRAGHFPPDTRTAAALLLLYPRDTGFDVRLGGLEVKVLKREDLIARIHD